MPAAVRLRHRSWELHVSRLDEVKLSAMRSDLGVAAVSHSRLVTKTFHHEGRFHAREPRRTIWREAFLPETSSEDASVG